MFFLFQNFLSLGSWRFPGVTPAALGKCCLTPCLSCLDGGNKQEIYKDDIDFKGYMEVTCEELCNLHYHLNCWKEIKKQHDPYISKITDRVCFFFFFR